MFMVRGFAFAAVGCAVVLACRGDWGLAAIPAAAVLALVALRVRRELLATKAAMCGEPVPGRHRRRGRPRELRQVPAIKTP